MSPLLALYESVFRCVILSTVTQFGLSASEKGIVEISMPSEILRQVVIHLPMNSVIHLATVGAPLCNVIQVTKTSPSNKLHFKFSFGTLCKQ